VLVRLIQTYAADELNFTHDCIYDSNFKMACKPSYLKIDHNRDLLDLHKGIQQIRDSSFSNIGKVYRRQKSTVIPWLSL
jgi:hypothetical protein